jgi:predicted helicase
MRTLDDVLVQLRDMSQSTREQGDYFERLIVRVLKVSPWYDGQFSNIWLWNEWPARNKQIDSGIDIVAERADDGALVGIQCKFYEDGHYLDRHELNSFFAALGQKPFHEGMVFSTTDNWSKQAELWLENPTKPVNRVRVQDLRDSGIDWSTFIVTAPEQTMRTTGRMHLRPHQRTAINAVIDGFMVQDRGQLIMACGTGKTFTSLKLVEELVPKGGHVLFLVPSISLMQQTLTEWKRETDRHMRCYAVCSDVTVGRKQDDTNEIRPYDLVIPATTDPRRLSHGFLKHPAQDLTIIFSTYQSITKVSGAQHHTGSILPEFDLVICDEAHRTTGVAANRDERSEFLKVHDNDAIRARKRLYMTATPRIYTDESQKKAKENEYLLASMDDVRTYGPEFHRLGFGQAVQHDLLSDYKVLILTVSEAMLQRTIDLDSPENLELNLDDAVKIIGCWNGLAKRDDPSDGVDEFKDDPEPMRRAVAFSRTIKDSKHIRNFFPQVTDQFTDALGEPDLTRCEIEHVDGMDSVLRRSQMLDWLKADVAEDETVCRILTNARCLSEGVDVPALDAVLFLNPRDSVVDVVQSVGRVMRKSEGKQFGYIILPIPIPANQTPSEALNDNKNYKVVWQVLQALRAHDDRFNAMINTLELNQKRDEKIKIIGVGGGKSKGSDGTPSENGAAQLTLDPSLFEQWRTGIYARIVDKVGDRRYWDTWANDIASIANTHVERMQRLLSDRTSAPSQAFDQFLTRLHEEINPSVSREDAIEMLAQHLITRPVFEALFAIESFSVQNPVSLAMQHMLDSLGEHTLEEERTTLDKFYRSVHERAAKIDNAEGRQKVVIELYDKFFKNAFPKMAERLGIVYTPIEVVDYLLHSADYVLRQHFGKGLTDEGVHVLDPFTGTGTFITRLLQSGLIEPEDAARKFESELHANEIVLLAYYIAAVNIEMVYQEAFGGDYRPFTGIVWTDTFQMTENEQAVATNDGAQFKMMEFSGSVNSGRADKQVRTPIRVIVGNPPYSAGQESANDNNQNLRYPQLDTKIRATYAARSSGQNLNSLYDSYIRAIRWASDRIGDHGVVAFVTNAGFIDGNAMDGLRATLEDEFTSIWVFNARGNARTSGEIRQKEKGNVFGGGTRTPIALTVLAKTLDHSGRCEVYYHDIGDYLSREQKLDFIRDAKSIEAVSWTSIAPNEQHDWINQRDPAFEKFPGISERWNETDAFFERSSGGVKTNRDAWAYGFSRDELSSNMRGMIDVFNDETRVLHALRTISKDANISRILNNDPTKIKWSGVLQDWARRGTNSEFDSRNIVESMYRPFAKQHLYYSAEINERRYQMPRLFPTPDTENLVIYVTGPGAGKGPACLMTDTVPNLHMMDTGQAFPLYWFEDRSKSSDPSRPSLTGLDQSDAPGGYRRHDGITTFMLEQYQRVYGDLSITKEDIFYYVYGVLHSPEYRTRFESDLKKMLPRIPLTEEFRVFSRAGRKLGELHVGYEAVEPWPVAETRKQMPFTSDGQQIDDRTLYRVEKMRFGKDGKAVDKSVIVYNPYFTLSDIPLGAYDYIVNGKSALDWIMERYAVTQDKESKIVNDPNEWSDDPRYIIDLVKRIVRVSIETNRIVATLPALNERDVVITPR